MKREVRRLLLQFVDGAFMLILAIEFVHAHDMGMSVFNLLIDAALGLLLAFWLQQIWWFWGKWR